MCSSSGRNKQQALRGVFLKLLRAGKTKVSSDSRLWTKVSDEERATYIFAKLDVTTYSLRTLLGSQQRKVSEEVLDFFRDNRFLSLLMEIHAKPERDSSVSFPSVLPPHMTQTQ